MWPFSWKALIINKPFIAQYFGKTWCNENVSFLSIGLLDDFLYDFFQLWHKRKFQLYGYFNQKLFCQSKSTYVDEADILPLSFNHV